MKKTLNFFPTLLIFQKWILLDQGVGVWYYKGLQELSASKDKVVTNLDFLRRAQFLCSLYLWLGLFLTVQQERNLKNYPARPFNCTGLSVDVIVPFRLLMYFYRRAGILYWPNCWFNCTFPPSYVFVQARRHIHVIYTGPTVM